MSKFKGKPLKSTENMQNVLDGAETDFDIPERGITKETVQYFKLLRKMDRVNGCVDAYYFPVTKKGNLSGYIKVSPNRSKKDGRFSTVGDVDVQCDLLGQREAQQVKKKNTVFIVEGFWDILSSFQSLYNQQPNKGAFVPAVVSPALGIGNTKSPDGTNARQQIASNMEFIQGFNNIRVCFDNDAESKENVGQLGVQDCALVLQDFINIVLPCNDINDLLLSEGEKEVYFKLLDRKLERYQPEHIVTGWLADAKLRKPIAKGIPIKCLPVLSSRWNGVRDGEITTILAPSGVGKSTLCREIGHDLLSSEVPTGFMFLEETVDKTQMSMIALDNNVFLPDYRADPTIVSEEDYNKTRQKLSSNSMWLSHFGSLASHTLMQKLEWMYNAGMRRIILDHLSVVISGQESRNERKDIDILMTNLAEYVTRTNVSMYLVNHIKRFDKKIYLKDENGLEFLNVSMDMARGSAALEQLSFNIMTIEPQKTEDGSRGCFRVRSEKNREVGWLGVADYIKMHPQTGRLVPFQPESY